MGKGKKANVVAAIQQGHRAGESAVDSKKGCNCPIGCVVGESIPAGARKLPEGAVKTVCSNENCPAVPYQHGACFEKWEEFLADGVKRQQGCYRQQTKAAIQRELWDRRMAPMIVKLSTCPACHGHIRRVVQDERAELVWRQAAQVARNPQPPAAAAQRHNRNRAPPAATATTPQPVKRQPAINKAPMRVNTSSRPKTPASYDIPFRRPTTPMFAGTWLPPMPHDENYAVPPLPPVNADRWQEIPQPLRKKPQPGVDTNDLNEFPTLRDDAWDPVPRTLAAELRAAQATSSSAVSQPQQLTANRPPAFDPNNLTGAQLISELEDAVKAFSELWTAHEVVRDLLDRVDVRVMEEIANFGGLEQWLCNYSSTLIIRKNRIVLKSDDVPAQLKSFGNVIRILNQTGNTGIIYAEAYDTKIFFDVADCATDGCTTYFEDDIVSFKAETVTESAWHGCKWQAVFLELIQREERVAASARAKQTGQAQHCWPSTATVVESLTDLKGKDISSKSSASIEKTCEAVAFDIASIIAQTPYLQLHSVTNNKNIRSSTPVGAFRRIPMATVTPDDFHPSTTASSSGPLQTSSPLLPPDMDDDLPVTCGTDQPSSGNRSNCETPLSFDTKKNRKPTGSMTESTSSVDELKTSLAGDLGLDAWLAFDQSLEDGPNYASCSKEIKELARLLG